METHRVFFFLERVGELRINILRRWKLIESQRKTPMWVVVDKFLLLAVDRKIILVAIGMQVLNLQ